MIVLPCSTKRTTAASTWGLIAREHGPCCCQAAVPPPRAALRILRSPWQMTSSATPSYNPPTASPHDSCPPFALCSTPAHEPLHITMSINPVDPDTEPLLQQHGDGLYLERSSRSSLCSLRNTTDQPSPLVTKDAIQWRNLASLAFIILFYIFSNYLLVIPTLRLYERGVCREYYHERDGNSVADPDEELCKLPSIQARLATLLGWQMGLGAIPGLLTAVWFGSLADRYGRKSILLLAMVGEFVSWVWILLVCMKISSHLTIVSLMSSRLFVSSISNTSHMGIEPLSFHRRRPPSDCFDTLCQFDR